MKIPSAPKNSRGYYEARPGDVAGRDDLVVVDVRERDELISDLGHIHGVRHMPINDLLQQGLIDVRPDQAVVLVCRSGARSAIGAAHLIADGGFSEVYNLVGGMIRWNAEERPIARIPTWK